MAERNYAPANSTATIFNEDAPLANEALVEEWLDNQRRLEDYARVAEEERESDAMRHKAALGNMRKGYRSMLKSKLKDGELMTDRELWALSDGNEDDFERLRIERDLDLEKELKERELRPHSLEVKEQPSKAEAFFLGYDPEDDGEGEGVSVVDAGYFVPVLGSAMYGNNILDQVKRGGMPGALDAAIAVPFFGPRIKRAGKAFVKGFKAGRARRFAEGLTDKEYKTPLDYARTQLFDREGKLLGEW
ncbi:MAG: hypothetical protein J6U20_09995 [Fibrobacter sp.]|nr:hypothetical protein [Fibrobacter sp.]